MTKDNQIQMPGAFGGLMRYNEEYDSFFKFKPVMVIIFIVALAIIILALKIFFPVRAITGNVIPTPGFIWSLLI